MIKTHGLLTHNWQGSEASKKSKNQET